MERVARGKLSRAYLTYVDRMLTQIVASEILNIQAAGDWLRENATVRLVPPYSAPLQHSGTNDV